MSIQKWEELEGLELNGYTAYLREEVAVEGKPTTIYELKKGDYTNGFTKVRALFEELEVLCKHNLYNPKKYPLQDQTVRKYSDGKF